MKKTISGICAGICIAACLAFGGQVTNPVTGGPTGSAGGDLAGTYPNPTVAKSSITSGGAAFTLPISSATSTVAAANTVTTTYASGNSFTMVETGPNTPAGNAVWHTFGHDTGLANNCNLAYVKFGDGFSTNYYGCHNGFDWQFRSFRNGDFEVPHLITATNCASSASPAVCGIASAGSITIAASAASVTVNTTVVTANSQIMLQPDETIGGRLGVTCNTTLSSLIQPVVTGKVAGTSFTITTSATIVANPACYSFTITN